MFICRTENKQFTGIRCGIAIQDGIGKTEDVKVARELLALGYSVDPDPSPKPAKEPEKQQTPPKP